MPSGRVHVLATGTLRVTGGYPYFIQELGYAVWTVAERPVISRDDVVTALPRYEAKLDESFFRVRLDRATELQRSYLRAMADLGPEPQKALDVAEVMGRTSQNLGHTRAELINMGLLYTPEHGYAAFTVPHFDKFLIRAIPRLEVPARKLWRPKKQCSGCEADAARGSRRARHPTCGRAS